MVIKIIRKGQHGSAGKRGKTMNNTEIKFGIRKCVLEDKTDRDFLKEYLATRDMSLTVITRVIDHCMVEIHSCGPSTYKPLDFTKFPTRENQEKWLEAIDLLKEKEEDIEVLWFESESQAIETIKSLYPDS